MLKYNLSIILSLFMYVAHTQVSNVTWALSTEQDKITIHFDLAVDRFFDVYIEALLDGQTIKPLNLSGDVGKYLKGGDDKQVVWDVLRDNITLEGKLEIKVIAIDLLDDIAGKKMRDPSNPKAIHSNNISSMSWVGLALGSGSVAYGLSLGSKSQKLYEIYKSNRTETAAVFQTQSREDHYLEANRKHKSGLILLSTGGIALLYGLYKIVHKRDGKLTSNHSTSSKFYFSPSFSTPYHDQQWPMLPGAAMALRF